MPELHEDDLSNKGDAVLLAAWQTWPHWSRRSERHRADER
jgi:hypothetical protein